MKTLSSVIIGFTSLSFGFMTVLKYDALTGLRAKIDSGAFDTANVRMYTTVVGYQRDGAERNAEIIKTKYKNAYDCQAGVSVEACASQFVD